MVYHSLTGEIPVALHFNFDWTKWWYMDYDALWGKVWWTRPEERFRNIVMHRLASNKITFSDGSRRSWQEVCPLSLLPS